MAKDPPIDKWHSMDEIKAMALTTNTQLPSMVCAIPLTALPPGIQQMPGLTSAYVSSYLTTQGTPAGVSAQGEFAAVRIDAGVGKGYNYVFGVSSDNRAYFSGPRTDIPAHHFRTSEAVPISSLFVGTTHKCKR